MAYKRISPIPIVEGGTGAQTFTAHSLLIGEGTSAIVAIGAATNGQLVIGSTGNDPALSTLTAGTGVSITNGAGSITIASSNALAYTAVSTSPYVVLTTDDYLGVDSSGGIRQINLPNAPSVGRIYTIKDKTGSAATNNITVTTVGGAVTIDGTATFVMNTAYQAVNVMFNGTSYEVW